MLLLMPTLLVLSVILLYGFLPASDATVLLVTTMLTATASCIFDILFRRSPTRAFIRALKKYPNTGLLFLLHHRDAFFALNESRHELVRPLGSNWCGPFWFNHKSGRIRFYSNIDCCEIHERIFPIIADELDRRMNKLFKEANGSNTDDFGLAADNRGQAFVQAYSEIMSLSI